MRRQPAGPSTWPLLDLMARTEGLVRAILGPMPDLVIAMLVLAVMATVMGAIIWYLNQIRKDRPDPVLNPAWPSIMRPSPHRLTSVATTFRHCDVMASESPSVTVTLGRVAFVLTALAVVAVP
jgi:hypothetical protein